MKQFGNNSGCSTRKESSTCIEVACKQLSDDLVHCGGIDTPEVGLAIKFTPKTKWMSFVFAILILLTKYRHP